MSKYKEEFRNFLAEAHDSLEKGEVGIVEFMAAMLPFIILLLVEVNENLATITPSDDIPPHE